MSSVVISGNTSGTITLDAPAVAGTTTLTLPATSGTVIVNSGAQTIEFADGSAGAPSITNSGDTNTGMFFPAADTIAFAEGGTERMRIDSSGNVLVGTTSNFGFISTDIGANRFTAATAAASLTHTTTSTVGRPAITVASIGNGEDSAFRTVVSPDGGSTFNGWTCGVNVETGSDIFSWVYNSGQSTRIFGAGAAKMRLTTGGGLSTTTGSLGTISDIRMKKDVVDATAKLDELMQLRVVNYVLIDDPEERKMLGFVAQEIEQVFPGLVEEFDVRDQETKELVMRQKSVKTTVLIPMLVKSIQEQQTIINDIKAELDNVKTELATLKGAA